ncbi:hypothetical protein [Novosphingobium sp. SG720]|uniref:hypothetical protein n=1 Tax=Novosphingobium sp. SG720 TaxID=2586998 RepID=UPI0014457645|nr:hypothetical protein [Novosphingobium sp. SG720]NKJ40995.1 hypothetical protein [Novosphingobium sp. SG720]
MIRHATVRLGLACAGLAALAAPALARHAEAPAPPVQPVPLPPMMVPYGQAPAPCTASGEPDRHGWPPACSNAPIATYPAPGYPAAPYYQGQVPVYSGAWTAPPGYYVAGVVMVPVPVGNAACQPCGETRTVTTTRTVDVPMRQWRRVPPRHPPLHDKRVKEKRIKE